GGVTFRSAQMTSSVEITGPVAAKLWLSSQTADADIFLALRLFDPSGKEITFIGSNDPRVPVGLGVTSKEKLAEFPTADSFPVTFGPKLDVVYWQAMFAPAGTPDSIVGTLNKALQNAVSDPALVKIWAAEDVSVFPSDQRSPAAASALMNS